MKTGPLILLTVTVAVVLAVTACTITALIVGGPPPPQTLYGRPVLPEMPVLTFEPVSPYAPTGTCVVCGHKMAIPARYARLNATARYTRELTCPECGDREPVAVWEQNAGR